jgi:hypothetical protein
MKARNAEININSKKEEKMNTARTQEQAMILVPSAPSLLNMASPIEENRARRKVWRQMLKFVIACMQVKRNDMNLETWRRLENRNEASRYERPDFRAQSRFF